MRRRGHSLPEVLIALTLTAAMSSALAGAFSAARTVARRHSWIVRSAEALRVSTVVLGDELRVLDPTADLRIVAPDSVALRAFRGGGVVCAADRGTAVFVRYRGLREPEPAKDSVLVVDSIGAVRASALLESERAADTCTVRDGESLYRWSVSVPAPAGTLLLLFESGSYHLSDRALRYRRGDGGRQPLTADLLDDRASMFLPVSDARAGGGIPLAIEGIFALRPDRETGTDARPLRRRIRFTLLNVPGEEARP